MPDITVSAHVPSAIETFPEPKAWLLLQQSKALLEEMTCILPVLVQGLQTPSAHPVGFPSCDRDRSTPEKDNQG